MSVGGCGGSEADLGSLELESQVAMEPPHVGAGN